MHGMPLSHPGRCPALHSRSANSHLSRGIMLQYGAVLMEVDDNQLKIINYIFWPVYALHLPCHDEPVTSSPDGGEDAGSEQV